LFLYEFCSVDSIGEAIGSVVFDEDTKPKIINSIVVEERVDVDLFEMVSPSEKEILHVSDVVCINPKHFFFKNIALLTIFFNDTGERLATAARNENQQYEEDDWFVHVSYLKVKRSIFHSICVIDVVIQ